MKPQLLRKNALVLVICLLPSVFLFSLANAKESDKDTAQKQDTPVFYPPLPDSPRIQYLTSFSSAGDVKEKKKKGWLADFILGEQNPEDLVGPQKPYGVTLAGHKIYVADVRGAGYAIFDLAKKDYRFVYGSGAGNMPTPVNIFITDEGYKYVADTFRKQVLAFDRSDKFLRAYGEQDQFKPADVAVVDDRLYIADVENSMIHVLDKNTGATLFTFGGPVKEAGEETGEAESDGEQDVAGNEEGEGADQAIPSGEEDRDVARLKEPDVEFKLVNSGILFMPTNMAVGPEKNIYVTDTGHFRVVKYSPEGEFLQSIGSGVGVNPGNFARPKGIAVDRDGLLYVVDAAYSNVQMFDKEGQVLMFFGEPGANHPASLNLPAGISISYDDNDYFSKFATKEFKLEYVILVASQFGDNKINVYGFGRHEGMAYPEDE